MSLPAFSQEVEHPERVLWLGVILQALDDYWCRAPDQGPGVRVRAQKDAADFLFAAHREGDLELVAQAAGVDVTSLREAARRAPPKRTHRVVGQRRRAEP